MPSTDLVRPTEDLDHRRPPGSRSGYIPQLDSLRAVAVTSVMWEHWAPRAYRLGLPWQWGVQLFFVLSGFLITGILLDSKAANQRAGVLGHGAAIRTFYLRRFLRIFPLYYTLLALTALVNYPGIRAELPWHATYLSNYMLILRGEWGYAGHLWSLSVEEQFYLFWPALVFLLSRRALRTCLVALVFVGPISRVALLLLLPGNDPALTATPACMDSLSLGGLLAFVMRERPRWWLELERRPALRRLLVVAAVALSAGSYFLLKPTNVGHAVAVWFVLPAFAASIYACTRGVPGILGILASNPFVRYLGKISYGVYLLHGLAWLPVQILAQQVPALGRSTALTIATSAALTVAGASVSWFLLERPLLALKDRISRPASPA